MEQASNISTVRTFRQQSVFSDLITKVLDLISLAKPGVISLLLVSTCCPMILASNGQVGILTVFWALLGGALISGSAGAINCIWDRDIDKVMSRTKNRPLPAGRLGKTSAFIFAMLTGVAGILALGLMLNVAAAAVALFGHFFYVFVYTIWLKRRTPQNIVIGGAAGAVPPVVGWVAVTGSVDVTAWLLFLIVFLWTPPHFWALALNKNEDYKRAGVPMLPVVAGEASTHKQMLWYALSLIPVSILLAYVNESLGWFSIISMTVLSSIFAYKTWQLKTLINAPQEEKTKKAWDVFGFSIVYLALFFVCLVVDSTLV